MKKRKSNKPIKPIDVFESEIKQAQMAIDEQTRVNLNIINQDRLALDANAPAVTVKPEVNEKKRKVSSLYRLFIGDKPIGYCGNLMQIINIIHETAQNILRRKAVEKRQQEEEAKQAEAKKREAENTPEEGEADGQ
jgi:hypothetical protein